MPEDSILCFDKGYVDYSQYEIFTRKRIWSVMLANLLLMILKSHVKRKWAFSNMVSVIRQHLMSYIDARSFSQESRKSLAGAY